MTAGPALEVAGQLDAPPQVPPSPAPRPAGVVPPGARARRRWHLPGERRQPGWPLVAALGWFPLWWLLGLGEFAFALFAVPMAWTLMRRGRRVRVPPYFGVWLAYLVWSVGGGLLLGLPLPGSLPDSGGIIGWSVRLLHLASATVVLLYLGNLDSRLVPQGRVLRLLCVLFAVTVAGGLLGVLAPHFSFTSPFERVLPRSLAGNFYVQQLVHPASAQVQDVLGFSSPRPKAPFAYTNTWGNNLTLLGIWFFAAVWARRSGTDRTLQRRRVSTALVTGLATIPVIYSLNRGLWIGLGLCLAYAAVRALRRGKIEVVLVGSILAIAGLGAVTVSPLGSLINERLQNPHSNTIRATLNAEAVHAAELSPLVGWGSSRAMQGSPTSIGIGKTSSCPQCGNAPIGSTGELWFVLISNGFLGAVLFYGYLALCLFRFRGMPTPIGVAGILVLLLAPYYALFYTAMPGALYLTFLSIALLWREQEARRRPMPFVADGRGGIVRAEV